MPSRLPRSVLSFVSAAALTWASAARADSLPMPTGIYQVGSLAFELVDISRSQAHAAASTPRTIPVTVFYPTRATEQAPRPYLPPSAAQAEMRSLAANFKLPVAALDHLLDTATHSLEGAPPAHAKRRFPVVLFSHGLRLYPLQNTALAETLASHGYVVVALAHPGDAVELELGDGSRVTTYEPTGKENGYQSARQAIWAGRTFDERTAAIPEFERALAPTRLGESVQTWRRDMLFVASRLRDDLVPEAARDVFAAADAGNIALTGMSFGGDVAAGTCHLIRVCRATVNLDGAPYDTTEFNVSVQRPLLMLSSDWSGQPSAGQTADPEFTATDLAFEEWAHSGQDADVYRVRVKGVRHLGLTDLLLLMDGPERNATVGEGDPAATVEAVDDAVLAFLDVYLKHAPRRQLQAALARSPVLAPHGTDALRSWAIAKQARER